MFFIKVNFLYYIDFVRIIEKCKSSIIYVLLYILVVIMLSDWKEVYFVF